MIKTSAVYQTGDGRCTMRLGTQGVVRAGNDLARDAEGRVTLSSATQPTGAPPLDAVVALRGGDLTIDGALGAEIDVLLAADLAVVGCSPDADERAELRGPSRERSPVPRARSWTARRRRFG